MPSVLLAAVWGPAGPGHTYAFRAYDTTSPETCLGGFRVDFTAESEANSMILRSELVKQAVGTDQFSSLVSSIKPNSLRFPHLHSGNDDTCWTGLW